MEWNVSSTGYYMDLYIIQNNEYLLLYMHGIGPIVD